MYHNTFRVLLTLHYKKIRPQLPSAANLYLMVFVLIDNLINMF
jgi:hypothetical protein